MALLAYLIAFGSFMTFQAVVLRSHAGGYLVNLVDCLTGKIFFCQARGRLKKERVSIVVGDRVEVEEVDEVALTGVITAQLPRRNLLERPTLANVDQVVIVQAVKQPDFSPLLCDRYLVHFQLAMPFSKPVICFNKSDLASQNEQLALRSIYEPLGYFVIFVSARTGAGIDDLRNLLAGKISVFAGASGVGKSTILNNLSPGLELKTGVMENDFGVGRHTTTASELYCLNLDTQTWVADTPGFNLYDFLHPEPKDVADQFPEIAEQKDRCHFKDCLHTVEKGCAVTNIDERRYQSYLTLVEESKLVRQEARKSSTKVEKSVKTVGGDGNAVSIPRLNKRYRQTSRRKQKQESFITDPDLADDLTPESYSDLDEDFDDDSE